MALSLFNIRVELLNGANPQDYDDLHARMRRNGCNTVIVANNRTRWHLPPAEYVHVAEAVSAIAVRDKVRAIVQNGLRPGLGYRTYVTQIVDWASDNLEPAR
ncbi:TPA: hypothetical protein QDB26_005348 [Burkholderia vietnamiensis]|nr:hypothetical protein [Burkholderia vietnamiensis]HDR9216557.1 hypothetical protein [Burkholderia vietnamiensis]